MANLVISGDSSGSITLAAPAVSGTTILTLPTTSGTLITTAGAASLTTSGNLTFTGTGNRITGDFSNATVNNRVGFQSSTGTFTSVSVLGPGASQSASIDLILGNDATNTSRFHLLSSAVDARLSAGIYGTGTYVPMTFFTGGSERLRIDTSGNVGIGTSSPAVRLHVQQAVASGASTTGTNQFYVENNGAVGISLITPTANQATIRHSTALDQISSSITFDGASRFMAFNTVAGTERMRIPAGGGLLIGTTSTVGSALTTIQFSSNSGPCLALSDTTIQNTATFISFNASTTRIGGITANGTTAVAYNTSSDYRLKENIAPMTGALDIVAQLKPVTYKWKTDGSAGQGFIAHELQAVVPDCVTGDKDAVDEDGKPAYQGVDTSFLVATLTAAIQELNAKVTALEAQLGAK